jgi:hypothetical protein
VLQVLLLALVAHGIGAYTTARKTRPANDPPYPIMGTQSIGDSWVATEARAAYPSVFLVVDNPDQTGDVDQRPLRSDLSRVPVDARNYRALRAIAVAFFELHERAEEDRGGELYFSYSFQATKMIAIPWRLYGEIPDVALRSVILDFYEDVLFGAKPGLGVVRGRYTRVVADLARKESDPALRARIDDLVSRARGLEPEGRR